MPRTSPTFALAATLVATAAVGGCDDKKPSDGDKKPAATATATAPKSIHPPIPKVPGGLEPVQAPKDNPTTPAKVALGHMLFFDKRLSADGSRACYSCHQNEDGTGGHEPTAIGAMEKPLTRHAPIIWNVAYLPKLYWDGRSDSLEAQAKGAWGGGNMGVGPDNLKKKADEIAKIDGYKKLFYEVFPGKGVSPTTIAQALAAYERTLLCGDTAWDKFQAGDKSALSAEQQKGLTLFTGKAGCHECHTPPMFSDAYASKDGAFHNVGVGLDGKKKEDADPGRAKASENDADFAQFKTPTLRNVSKSAPYFHDGSIAKLDEAVKFMAGGGFANPGRDPKLKDRKLSDEEIAQLVAFLGSLTCPDSLEEPKLP